MMAKRRLIFPKGTKMSSTRDRNGISRTSSKSQFGGAVDPPSPIAAAGVVGADASSESKLQDLIS